jgi:hypothetical protein
LRLDDDAVLVRGFGLNELASLIANVEAHYAKWSEWAVSSVSLPGLSALEIVARAPQIRQRQFRWGVARNFVAAGLVPVEDRPPHALVMLPAAPTDETWAAVLALFPVVEPNLYFEERRRTSR